MRSTKISDYNREILRSICEKDDSYDTAISRLVEMARISTNARRKLNKKSAEDSLKSSTQKSLEIRDDYTKER